MSGDDVCSLRGDLGPAINGTPAHQGRGLPARHPRYPMRRAARVVVYRHGPKGVTAAYPKSRTHTEPHHRSGERVSRYVRMAARSHVAIPSAERIAATLVYGGLGVCVGPHDGDRNGRDQVGLDQLRLHADRYVVADMTDGEHGGSTTARACSRRLRSIRTTATGVKAGLRS